MAVRKIDDKTRTKIFEMFTNENVTKTALAKEFDCSPRTIGRIIKEMESNTLIDNPDFSKDLNWDKSSKVYDNETVSPVEVFEFDVDLVEKIDYAYNISTAMITLYVNGDAITIDSMDVNFHAVRMLLIEDTQKSYEEAHDLMDIKKLFVETCSDRVNLKDNQLFIDDKCVSGDLVDLIIMKLKEEIGSNVDKYIKFLEKCYDNPSVPDLNTIYRFVKANSVKIDDDGDIIAYRVVTHDYLDKHTGTIDNSVGAKPKMDRKDVDHDNNVTCSSGLHACAFSYVQVFSDSKDRVVKVKISPYNVCSVPTDYDDAKARVCEYEVIADVY